MPTKTHTFTSFRNTQRWAWTIGLFAFWIWSPFANGQTTKPPVVDEAAKMQASMVASLPDGSPEERLAQLLEAVELSSNALFALAASHPGVVEQVTSEKYRLALNYILSLPAADVHRLRRGETVIRTDEVLQRHEKDQALAMAEYFNFRRFKPEKLRATRVGTIEGRLVRVEVTVAKNKKMELSGELELAWPSTPERDELSRNRLARHFGARPSATLSDIGAPLPLQLGSFERLNAIQSPWHLDDAVVLGSESPVSEIAIDNQVAVDGSNSVRFYADIRTRRFKISFKTCQSPRVWKLSTDLSSQNLRVEFQQKETDVHLSPTFLNEYRAHLGNRNPTRPPRFSPLGSHRNHRDGPGGRRLRAGSSAVGRFRAFLVRRCHCDSNF